MATYAGQNAGAGKVDRICQGVRSATLIGGIYSIAACIVLTVFGGVIPLLFVDASETVVIHQAHQFLTFNSLFYIPLTIVNVWRFTIQGMGYSLLAILAGVCEMIAAPWSASCWCRSLATSSSVLPRRLHGCSPMHF